VQDNMPMYVFSIDIPFKGSQSLSNMRSKVTSVSYLRCHWHCCACDSDVNDTAVPCIFEKSWLHSSGSMTPLCNQLCRLSSWIRSHTRKVEVVWWKKQSSKIFCQGPFNK
jgi:hypothetical protein